MDYQVKWIMLFTTMIKHRCSTKKMIIKYIKRPQALKIPKKKIAFKIPQL
jgi:hypothetical protein